MWYTKCVIDSFKALMPFQRQIRGLKYKLKPYVGDTHNQNLTITQGLLEIEWLRSVTQVENADVMEVGSGWQPLIPILFSLAGAGKVYLCDQNRLMTAASLATALDAIRREKQQVAAGLGMSPDEVTRRLEWDSAAGLESGLRKLRLEYLAPCDCRAMDLPANSVDIVISRAVLEHIPGPVIQDIFHESRRLLRSGGWHCHIVDNSDHWEFVDKSLLRINFLRYEDWIFRWTAINSLNYQNRLRHPQYLDMLRTARFEIVREQKDVDEASLRALPTFPLSKQFRQFAPEDLAATTTYVLARKPASTDVTTA